jgi:putative thioredoxin
MNYEMQNFETDVVERSRTIPVLVDFWAAWCGPCKILGPVLEKLAANTDRWVLAKVDTEAHPELAREYGIRSIPAVKLFIDGAVAGEFAGAIPEQQILRWLDKVLPGKFQKDLDAIRTQLKSGDAVSARTRLTAILEAEPSNEEARVLLARCFVPTDFIQAEALVSGIEEHSPFSAVVGAIRSFAAMARTLENADPLPESAAKQLYVAGIEHIVAGRYDEGVAQMIGALRSDRYYNDDAPRKACVAVFQFLGEEDDVTIKHRRDFGSALYV